MKRSRVASPAAESSAGAARRVCTREDDTAHHDADSTFFFVRLPNGKTITADMPLRSTIEELVQYLEYKVGSIKARHCLVIGKHTAQLDETLRAAGVSRDCTVQIQLTRVQTPYDCYNQQLQSIRQLLHRLQQPLLEPAELMASLTTVIGWLVPSEGDDLWKAATEFRGAGYLAKTAQDAVAACCCLGNHPKSSPAEVGIAISWLLMLSNWAHGGILHASKAQYGEVKDKLVPGPFPQRRIECYEVAVVVELWLMSTAAAMQVTLYNSKLREAGSTGVDDMLETHLGKLSKMTGEVAQWLEEPIDPATLSWLSSHADCVLSGCALPAASWCTNGRATLLYLELKLGDLSVTTIAALLQGMAAMWADHSLSCYQHALSSLPGLNNAVPASLAINSSSTIPSSGSPLHTAAHRAGNTCVPSASVLLTLLHASVLVNPDLPAIAKNFATTALHFEGPGVLRWQLYLGARAPAAVVQHVVQSLAESAMHRLLVGGEISEADCKKMLNANFTSQAAPGEPDNPFFGGSHRVVWNFMPLIRTALDNIQAFADFASLHNITRNAAGLPELLRNDGALLNLMQSWLLLGKLAAPPPAANHDRMPDSAAGAAPAAQPGNTATASYDSMVETVGELLEQPLVKKWLEVKSSGLRPSLATDEDAYVVMQALMNLLAGWPRLAGAVPTSTRTRWLQEMVFPRHPTITNDDDDDDDTELELDIRRESILEDSYAELLSLSPRDLRSGIRVRFLDEEAEGEGVLREWLVQLAGQLFSPMAALFECGATDMSVQHPSAAATIQTDWRKYFRLAGRVVGLALRHRVPLGVQLSSAFYKALQSVEADPGKGLPHNNSWMTAMTAFGSSRQAQQQPWESWGAAADAKGALSVKLAGADLQAWRPGFRFVSRPWRAQTNLDDLQQMDLQVTSSLQFILDNPCNGDDLALNWTAPAPAVPGDVGDAESEVELVPGGADLAVNEDNKCHFVDAMTEHKLLGGCKEQALWFYVGLCDISEHKALDLCQGRLLLPLTVTDFNSNLCGSRSSLTVPAWQEATTLGSGLRGQRHQQVVDMFWEVVGGLDEHQRRQLLRFWTGITHLPASGFSGLGRKLQIVALNHTEAAAEAPAAAEGVQAAAAEDEQAAAAEAPAAAVNVQAAAAEDEQAAAAEAPAAAVNVQAAAAEGEQAAATAEAPAAAERVQAAAAEGEQAAATEAPAAAEGIQAAAAEGGQAAATAEAPAAAEGVQVAAAEGEQAAAAAEAPAAAVGVQAAAAEDELAAAAAQEPPAAVDVHAAAAEDQQAAAAEDEQAAAAEDEQAAAADAEMEDAVEDHDLPAAAGGDQAQPADAGVDLEAAAADDGQPAEHGSGTVDSLGNGASIAPNAGAEGDAGGTSADGLPNPMQLRRVVERRLAALQTAVQSMIARTAAQHPSGVLQLPRAHTCFMQLLLPVGYQNAAEMRRALLVALENVDYFGTA